MIGQKLTAAANWLGDLSADIFWDTVTSYPAISILGVVAIAGFAVSHTPLIERFFPSVIPYVKAAGLVCLVSAAMLMFAFGYRVADGRAEIEQLKNDLAWSEFQLGEQKAAADAADELKQDSDAKKAAAEGELDEYKRLFGPDPGVITPPRGYLDWLHGLQRHKPRAARADQPQRGLVERVRALGSQRR
jgi:hypothetical protein